MSVDGSVLSAAIDQDGSLVGIGQLGVVREADPLLAYQMG